MPHFFTSDFKQRVRLIAACVTTISGAAPFVAGLLVMQTLGDAPHGPLAAAVAALSFALGGLLPWLSQDLMGLAGNGRLQRSLRRHLTETEACDLSGACFVGFSPGERLHVWQGETNRDIGFLTITGDTLIYRGDDFSWSLPRDLIDHLDLTPIEAGMQRILIRWHEPREAGRAFSIESREALTVSRARNATRALFAQLKEWHKQPTATAAADGEGAEPAQKRQGLELGLPAIDQTGGQMIEEPPSGSCLSILALGVIVLIAIFRISGTFFALGQYYQGILWAGLISVIGALCTGYLLHYLQAWEAEHRQQNTLSR